LGEGREYFAFCRTYHPPICAELITVHQKDSELLTNEAGEVTCHLMVFWYRTIGIIEKNGIKPAYVVDGKPPELKEEVSLCLIFYCSSKL